MRREGKKKTVENQKVETKQANKYKGLFLKKLESNQSASIRVLLRAHLSLAVLKVL